MFNDMVRETSRLDDTVEIYRKKIVETSDVASKAFKPKRVAAYCRVSKNIEMQESSLENQMEAYERIISEKVDWQLVEVYYDKGITGTCAAKRPGFMRMIEDCKAGKIDLILAKSISRFARNTVDMLEYTRMLKGIGVSVYFEKERIDTGDLTSEMLLTVYAAFAQEESHSISENVRRGYRQRFQMGIPKYSKLYGYRTDKEDKNKWYVVEEEAEVVREVFGRYLRGETAREISEKLVNAGIPSPWSTDWYPSSICKMLKNERYAGDVIMQKTVVVDVLNHIQLKNNDGIVPQYYKKGHHDAIIDRDDFDTVQRMLELKVFQRGTQQYPYYDYLRCPKCGKQMVQYMSCHASNPPAWICSDLSECQEKYILTKYIDRAVIGAINELPSCLSGYEDIIRDAQEHFANGGAVELYYLKKLIEKIEIDDDFMGLKITFKFGKTVESRIKFDKPSENGNPTIEYKDDKLFVDGRFFTTKEGARVTQCINRVQLFLRSLKLIEPGDGDTVYRLKPSVADSKVGWWRRGK